MRRILSLGCLATILVALAPAPVASAVAAPQAGTTRISVDTPAAGAAVDPTRSLTVAGWAVDPAAVTAAAPAGVDAVHVYLNGEAGRGTFVGAAEFGLPRPDVAAAVGDQRLQRGGFRFAWRPSVLLDAGPQQLYVYARNGAGVWSYSTVEIVLPAAPAAAVAVATAAFTERALGLPQGGPDCARADSLGFRLSLAEPDYSDSWYDTSQLLADAAMVAAGRDDALCRMRKGYRFIQKQWDTADPIGGYFARIYGDGRYHGGDKFADDNALAGLALLAAARATPDPAERAVYLQSAAATAEFLMRSGLWDDVFEGGFWWNTQKGGSEGGKTGQTNAVCAFFMLRMHRATGEQRYLDWGVRTLNWLDRVMWVPEQGLYRESIAHEDRATRTGVYRWPGVENYIQSIAAEAWLEVHDLVGPQSGGLARAQQLAGKLRPVFWNQTVGGYDLLAGKPQVVTVYSAWLTPAFLRLYRADGDTRWLDLARENVQALDAALRDETAGGYFHTATVENGAVALDRDKHTVDQAWMQYALANLVWPEALLP